MGCPLQHYQYRRAETLPSRDQTCHVCGTAWGLPEDGNTSGCTLGSQCPGQALTKNRRCPLCGTNICVLVGVDPRHHRIPDTRLLQLERSRGLDDWPIPSTEEGGRADVFGARGGAAAAEEARRLSSIKCHLEARLGVLNSCHGTYLSLREFQVCVSLVDYRLGTPTPTPPAALLDAFFHSPLFECGAERLGLEGGSELKEGLESVNRRAGTSFLADELELVVSLMNHVHGSRVGLLEVLGVPGAGAGAGLPGGGGGGSESPEGLQRVDGELVRAFGRLDVRVGSRNAVEDLGDVFSEAML